MLKKPERVFLFVVTIMAILAGAACGGSPPASTRTPAPTAQLASTRSTAPTGSPSSPPATPLAASPTVTLSPVVSPTTEELESPGRLPDILKPGIRYEDVSGDIEQNFLDVVAFQVTVEEGTEIVEAVFEMRDLPETVLKGHALNTVEYLWSVRVYTDPEDPGRGGLEADYSLNLFSFTLADSLGETPTGPTPGAPASVPFDQLIDSSAINDQTGESLSPVEYNLDREAGTITMRGRVPGINQDALFSFVTSFYDGTEDRPDLLTGVGSPITPVPGSGETARPTESPPQGAESNGAAQGVLPAAGKVRAYPGPVHYAGDVLTLEIELDGFAEEHEGPVTLRLDEQAPFEVPGMWQFNQLILKGALDTSGLSGEHTLRITAQGGGASVDETYRFEVKPAGDRPSQEEEAEWLTRMIPCCTLHYISQTAAERDIEAIAERIQQAAEEFSALTGETVEDRLQIYIIDRMWGNGAFGGDGELVAVYTDRYYGPSLGLEGFKTLARHEFTHATGVDQGEQGFFLYNEGLAVFLAGGHYKPEPLAQRGAALWELDYFAPIGSSIAQHELGYLYGATLATYINETYGWEALWAFVSAASGDENRSPEALDEITRMVFDLSLGDFEADFRSWLESMDPGEQLDDLRLTVELQDLRRLYQERYAPAPFFIFGKAEEAIADRDTLPALIRETNTPANVAIELMMANGQRAIFEGHYAEAQQYVDALGEALASGKLEHPLAAEYLAVVQALEDQGYEVLSLDLQGESAFAQVTHAAPAVEEVTLRLVDGKWQIGAPG